MQPRINSIILAVDNLERAIEFYSKGLGLHTEGIMGSDLQDALTGAHGTICFFHLQNNLLFGLYERADLAKDAYIKQDSSSSTEFSLGYFVSDKSQVEEVLKQAEIAGATLTGKPYDRPWGVYSAYFKDLDGHLWEIIYDPRI